MNRFKNKKMNSMKKKKLMMVKKMKIFLFKILILFRKLKNIMNYKGRKNLRKKNFKKRIIFQIMFHLGILIISYNKKIKSTIIIKILKIIKILLLNK